MQRLEALAIEFGVEYVKLLGDQIVCATGFGEQPQRSADIMAEFALGALDYCARLFTKLERPLEFKLGLGKAHHHDGNVLEYLRLDTCAFTAFTGDTGHERLRSAPGDKLRLTHGFGKTASLCLAATGCDAAYPGDDLAHQCQQ